MAQRDVYVPEDIYQLFAQAVDADAAEQAKRSFRATTLARASLAVPRASTCSQFLTSNLSMVSRRCEAIQSTYLPSYFISWPWESFYAVEYEVSAVKFEQVLCGHDYPIVMTHNIAEGGFFS